MHGASLFQFKFVCGELSVTACGLKFNSLMLSKCYYFFLSEGINKHIIYYELGAKINIDLGGEMKILVRAICSFSIEKK